MGLILKMAAAHSNLKMSPIFLIQRRVGWAVGGRRSGDEGAVIAVAPWFAAAALQRLIVRLRVCASALSFGARPLNSVGQSPVFVCGPPKEAALTQTLVR